MKRLTLITVLVLLAWSLRGLRRRRGPSTGARPRRLLRLRPRLRRLLRLRPRTTMAPAPTEAPAAAPAAAGVGASAEGAASKGLTCLADAYNGKMKGTKVTMTGPFALTKCVKFDERQQGVRGRHRHRHPVCGLEGV